MEETTGGEELDETTALLKLERDLRLSFITSHSLVLQTL